jgi:NADH dehydrogenase [ubiquinone] 1 alpha subcomplex assembly factor 1
MLPSRRHCLTLLALGGASLTLTPTFARQPQTSMNFTDPEITRQLWLVNDGVMGGRSSSRIVAHPEGLIFDGTVSLDNNGGFASFRGPANFSAGASTLLLTTRGDGKRYQLVMRTEASVNAPLYKCSFESSTDWHTHEFRPEDFDAAFRGRPVNAAPLIFSDAKEFGILIADKQPGAFRLQIRQIQTR